jgi:hypothetical protein
MKDHKKKAGNFSSTVDLSHHNTLHLNRIKMRQSYQFKIKWFNEACTKCQSSKIFQQKLQAFLYNKYCRCKAMPFRESIVSFMAGYIY